MPVDCPSWMFLCGTMFCWKARNLSSLAQSGSESGQPTPLRTADCGRFFGWLPPSRNTLVTERRDERSHLPGLAYPAFHGLRSGKVEIVNLPGPWIAGMAASQESKHGPSGKVERGSTLSGWLAVLAALRRDPWHLESWERQRQGSCKERRFGPRSDTCSRLECSCSCPGVGWNSLLAPGKLE